MLQQYIHKKFDLESRDVILMTKPGKVFGPRPKNKTLFNLKKVAWH